MKNLLTFVLIILHALFADGQDYGQYTISDLNSLKGSWHGKLTYLDYTTGNPFSMPANLTITAEAIPGKYIFINRYPNEPKANSSDTIVISKDGKYIGNERIKYRYVLDNGSVVIVTFDNGNDGNENKPALFRHTYTFNKNKFTIKKEVLFMGEKNWMQRHEYSYTRER